MKRVRRILLVGLLVVASGVSFGIDLPEGLTVFNMVEPDALVKKDNRLSSVLEALINRSGLDTAKVQLYKSPNLVQNFVVCVESRKPTISPVEVGGRGAILCSLCNMSYVYDTGFDWDPEKNDFANGTGKGISLKRDFCRNGWEVRV